MTKAELIKVLVKSQETRRQIVGNLISFTHAKIEEINGYCALGALACEKKLFKQQNWVDGSPRDIVEPAYSDIINAYVLERVARKAVDLLERVGRRAVFPGKGRIITHLND